MNLPPDSDQLTPPRSTLAPSADDAAAPNRALEAPKTSSRRAGAPKKGQAVAEAGSERLQKLLSRAGIASRRAAEAMIGEGRVSVNGHVITELGFKADPNLDRIAVDGHPLRLPSGPPTVLLLNKPRGVMTTKDDPEGRSTVMELLPREFAHLHPIGRLDYDTSGLILLTDDGELTQLLTHPSHGVEKAYQARARGVGTVATIKKLEGGIALEDGPTLPCRMRVRAQTPANALVEISLREGRNRQIRRMLEAVGHPVSSLRRVRFGSVDLLGVPIGQFRVLLPGEVHQLRKLAESKAKSKPRAVAARAGGKKPVKARPKVLSDVVSAAHSSVTKRALGDKLDLSARPKTSTTSRPNASRPNPSRPVAAGAPKRGSGQKPSRTPRPSKAAPKTDAAKIAVAKSAALRADTAPQSTLERSSSSRPSDSRFKNTDSAPRSSPRPSSARDGRATKRAAPAERNAAPRTASPSSRPQAPRISDSAQRQRPSPERPSPDRPQNSRARNAVRPRPDGGAERKPSRAATTRPPGATEQKSTSRPALAKRIEDRWK